MPKTAANEAGMKGIQRAAILLISLGPERSAGIFKHLKEEEIDEYAIAKIAHDLKKGKVVVFPTDTVYGIGTNAYDEQACERIY